MAGVFVTTTRKHFVAQFRAVRTLGRLPQQSICLLLIQRDPVSSLRRFSIPACG